MPISMWKDQCACKPGCPGLCTRGCVARDFDRVPSPVARAVQAVGKACWALIHFLPRKLPIPYERDTLHTHSYPQPPFPQCSEPRLGPKLGIKPLSCFMA